MARVIVPNKAIILLDDAGNVTEFLLQYKIRTDGELAANFNTVSVLAAIDPTALSTMAQAALNSAKQSEGIS